MTGQGPQRKTQMGERGDELLPSETCRWSEKYYVDKALSFWRPPLLPEEPLVALPAPLRLPTPRSGGRIDPTGRLVARRGRLGDAHHEVGPFSFPPGECARERFREAALYVLFGERRGSRDRERPVLVAGRHDVFEPNSERGLVYLPGRLVEDRLPHPLRYRVGLVHRRSFAMRDDVWSGVRGVFLQRGLARG